MPKKEKVSIIIQRKRTIQFLTSFLVAIYNYIVAYYNYLVFGLTKDRSKNITPREWYGMEIQNNREGWIFFSCRNK
jgi:hypothetical protein